MEQDLDLRVWHWKSQTFMFSSLFQDVFQNCRYLKRQHINFISFKTAQCRAEKWSSFPNLSRPPSPINNLRSKQVPRDTQITEPSLIIGQRYDSRKHSQQENLWQTKSQSTIQPFPSSWDPGIYFRCQQKVPAKLRHV